MVRWWRKVNIAIGDQPLSSGQRCAGRNYNGRRCCTPEQPCGYGEGDCDGPGDGGGHDGHGGCRGELVCGSNNCKKFGSFYHDKDDCCDLWHAAVPGPDQPWGAQWTSWSSWGACSTSCGAGVRARTRYCAGPGCRHTQDRQETPCTGQLCYGGLYSSYPSLGTIGGFSYTSTAYSPYAFFKYYVNPTSNYNYAGVNFKRGGWNLGYSWRW